jgi:hypothetical protein
MLGVPDEEQQPGDGDLRLDVDLDVPDPGCTDFPGWPDLPESGAVRGWDRGDDARTGQRTALLLRQLDLDGGIASEVMVTSGPAFPHAPPGWAGGVILIGYTAALVAGGIALTKRRDVI